MDIMKFVVNRNLGYRVSKKDMEDSTELTDKLYDIFNADVVLAKMSTLEFIGMLWVSVAPNRIPHSRKPKKYTERKYINSLSAALDKHFPEAYAYEKDDNMEIRKAILPLIKELLIAIHFSCLSDSALKAINDKFSRSED